MRDIHSILEKQPILLFDGDCAFCNTCVKFLLDREKEPSMHFAALNSETGKALRAYFEIDEKIDSIILVRDYSAFIKSCAALRLTLYMRGLWPLLAVFLVIPPFLRNPIYDLIARRRSALMGRVESCAMVPVEQRHRILDR